MAKLQHEEGGPVGDGLEQDAVEDVVVRQTEELPHEEHGRSVHLQLVALHAQSLDGRTEHRADEQVHEEQHYEGVACRSEVVGGVAPRVSARLGPEEVCEVDEEDMQGSNQNSEQRAEQPEPLPVTQYQWGLHVISNV